VNALLGGAMDALAPVSQPAAPVVKRASVYYRWKDANGVVHVEQAPPTTGEFITIRSKD
jgi:hypothetical protein